MKPSIMQYVNISDLIDNHAQNSEVNTDKSVEDVDNGNGPQYSIADKARIHNEPDLKEPEKVYQPDEEHKLHSIGSKVEIIWPLNNAFYTGTISDVSDGRQTVNYDDCDVEKLENYRSNMALCFMRNSPCYVGVLLDFKN